jgi:BirA family biotin operon repressor/biotin-[acetyl-CoA-carboxylase] ligase
VIIPQLGDAQWPVHPGTPVYFDQIDSTNAEAFRLARVNAPKSLLLVAGKQTAGRGQRGHSWESDAGLNLLCTWLIEGDGLPSSSAIFMNMAVACALCDTGHHWIGERSKIKWPNDLWCLPKNSDPLFSRTEQVNDVKDEGKSKNVSPEYIENRIPDRGGKWGGILIENQMTGQVCRQSAIGFGLNINQIHFGHHLPHATSLMAQTSYEVDHVDVLATAIQKIQFWLRKIKSNETDYIVEGYKNRLWGYGKYCDFLKDGKKISARIDGIDPKTGALMLFDGRQMLQGIHPVWRHDLSSLAWETSKHADRSAASNPNHE